MGQELVLLSWTLLLQVFNPGSASAASRVDGALGGSVYFNVFVPTQVNTLIAWSFRNSPAALLIPGLPPRCSGQFVGRCNIFINGSLLLSNITYDDEGGYTMNANDDTGGLLMTENYELKVYAPLSAPILRSVTSSPLINGTNVSLQCDAGNQNVTSYTFYRDDQKIICSDRVICRGSFLDFTPISENDGGSYTCSIQNPGSSKTSDIRSLTVYVAVSNVAVTSNVSRLVWPGLDSVSLRCSAQGTNVSYSWSLQGAPISGGGRYTLTDNNATLNISPVTATDNGSFVCTATNLICSQNSSDVRLNLAAPVSAVTLTSNTSAVLWAGQDSVSLHCSARGSAITFSWRLNGKPVSPNPSYSITQSDSPPNSTLTISPVSRHDAGPFTCTANSETSDGLTINMAWLPEGTIICSAQRFNISLQLSCSWPGGQPAANVTMIFNDEVKANSGQVTMIANIPDDIIRSNFTCHGDQRGRKSDCRLRFAPPQCPGHDNTSIIRVKKGEKVVLRVNLTSGGKSQGSPQPLQILPAEFTWYSLNSGRKPLQNGDKFTVTSTSYTSHLQITGMSKAESGKYECRATNVVGSQSFIFAISVTEEVSYQGLNGGEIAGIVIGVIAGLAATAIVLFVLKSRKSSKKFLQTCSKTSKTPEVIYENEDFPPAHIYETTLPGAAIDTTASINDETKYQGYKNTTRIDHLLFYINIKVEGSMPTRGSIEHALDGALGSCFAKSFKVRIWL